MTEIKEVRWEQHRNQESEKEIIQNIRQENKKLKEEVMELHRKIEELQEEKEKKSEKVA